MKTFKTTLVCILACVLLFSMVGCGNVKTPAEQESGATDGTITLTYGTPLYVEAPHKAALDAAVAEYERLNPNIKIQMYGTEDGVYFDNLTTEILANSEGDMFMFYPENIARYAALREDGVFVNLDDIVTADVADNLVGQELCKLDGKNVAISAYAWGTTAMFYNKTILEECGIDPASIKNNDDLRSACEKIAAGGKYSGFGIEVSADYFGFSCWSRMVQRCVGGGLYFPNEQGPYTAENIIFDSEANRWAAKWWQSFIFDEGAGTSTYPGYKEMRENFWNGNLAFIYDGPWFIGMCEETEGFDMGNVGLIAAPDIVYNGQSYKPNPSLYPYFTVISNRSAHPAECKAFLTWLISDEAQAIIARCGMIPVSKSYVENSDYKTKYALNYSFADFLANNYATPVSDPAIPQQGELQQVLVDVGQAVFGAKGDVDTEFASGAQRMRDIMKRSEG